jgi:hypothetical protein
MDGQYTDLIAVLIDNPNLFCSDLLVDANSIALGLSVKFGCNYTNTSYLVSDQNKSLVPTFEIMLKEISNCR